MENLIKALQILLKYGNPEYPTHCEHDYLFVNIPYSIVSEEDTIELEKLGFRKDSEFGNDGFGSHRYGSC